MGEENQLQATPTAGTVLTFEEYDAMERQIQIGDEDEMLAIGMTVGEYRKGLREKEREANPTEIETVSMRSQAATENPSVRVSIEKGRLIASPLVAEPEILEPLPPDEFIEDHDPPPPDEDKPSPTGTLSVDQNSEMPGTVESVGSEQALAGNVPTPRVKRSKPQTPAT